MTVINAVGALPGLGRLIVHTLVATDSGIDRDDLYRTLLPESLHRGQNPLSNIDATLTALKDIGVTDERDGKVLLAPQAQTRLREAPITRSAYRKLLQHFMFSTVDTDPWRLAAGDTLTSGTKDINRALSWALAQDVRGTLTWNRTEGGFVNVELTQQDQLPTNPELRPFANGVRWGNFMRWATALGMAQPAFQAIGIYPDATVAIRDYVSDMPPGRQTIDGFLEALTNRMPVLSGGPLHTSFLQLTASNPDPDAAAGLLDTTVAQAILALEDEGVLNLPAPQADAAGRTIGLGVTPQRRITHVEVNEGQSS
ncbi:protein DpdG [Mycolicibacterium mucogenicum]|uniref:protein DpdG n=1 Tax=Mycolicibacterium mucogenicum TaxID=56689 RepID=UPI00226A47A4|nr:protein DpdG [Mycolicibacterium mucogenicum]MCX8557523.1 protein DpdG [Mycolicibacterium mucogenicum]